MKYQYFQYTAFSRFPFHTEEILVKATSKENAIKQIKKHLNKIGIRIQTIPTIRNGIQGLSLGP